MPKMPNAGELTYRQASAEDLIAFYGEKPKTSMRAIVFFQGDKIVAIGGVKRELGRVVAFSEIKPDANLSKMTIGRGARIVMDMIRTYKVPVWAAAERKGDETAKLIKHFGFEHQASDNESEIYTLWPKLPQSPPPPQR